MLRFGTDGVRGDADTDLTDELIVALGRAVARVLRPEQVLIGRDTRASGPRIEEHLLIGLEREGAAAQLLGVVPTPAIAFAATHANAPALIVSASHNPWTDNGVKVIGADGYKLSDQLEAAIEDELRNLIAAPFEDGARRAEHRDLDTGDAYVAFLIDALDGRTLDGLRVVVDCANGAAFSLGPRALRALGADLTVLHAEPDGRNINAACGSTHPESLQNEVRARGAAIGLALDGDGDRVIAVDEQGELVDGDRIMMMLALDLHARHALPGDAIVVTVMSNLGLMRALRAAEIDVVETPVGDRHVVAAMLEHGLGLGGEQSGHIVFGANATTGDGLLTGLFVCDLVQRTGKALSELAAPMVRVPQVLVNVRVASRVDLDGSGAVAAAITEAQRALGASGRVLVRGSGTEPLVRIMVEADVPSVAEETAERLRNVVAAEFGTA